MTEAIVSMLGCKTWALVGATANKEKFGYKILQVMRREGLTVYAVNPGVQQIDGEPCYPSLQEVPATVEAVDLVVPPQAGLRVLEDCRRLGIGRVWLQPGADAPEVVARAKELGLMVVHDACIMVELRKKGGR